MPKQQQKTASRAPAKRPQKQADELSPRQIRFIDEFLIDLNATQAAIRAGYSPKGASVSATRLLANAKISNALQAKRDALIEKTGITQERVITELARIGFSDVRKAFTPGGNILPPEEWDDEFAAAVSAVEVVSRPTGETDADGRKVVEHVHKIKMWDKNSALEKIAKHLGMFKDKDDDKPQGDTYIDNRVQVIQQVNSDLERIFGESLRSSDRPPREH